MTDIQEQIRTIAALKVIEDLVKQQTGTDKQRGMAALQELGVRGAMEARMPDGTPLGTVSIRKGRVTAKVTDLDALTEWVENHHPEHIVTVTSVRPAYVSVLLKQAQDAGAPVDKTGEVIPGVSVTEGEPYLATTLTNGAAKVVLAAVRSGWQPLALPGGDS
jgi:hypothetical protein